MKEVKILKKLVKEINSLTDRPRDLYVQGYNRGLADAKAIIESKICEIENI